MYDLQHFVPIIYLRFVWVRLRVRSKEHLRIVCKLESFSVLSFEIYYSFLFHNYAEYLCIGKKKVYIVVVEVGMVVDAIS